MRTWNTDKDGVFTGQVAVKVDNAFMSMFGLRTTQVDVTSAAAAPNAMVPTDATFELMRATGASWKKVELFIHEVGAATDTRVESFVYQPGWNDGGITQPTGTMTVTNYNPAGIVTSSSVYSQNGDFSWPAGVTGTVSLGKNYDNLYLVMTVQGDGCADGFANTSRTADSSTGYTYNKDSSTNDCVPEGTTKSYSGGTTTFRKNLSVHPVDVYSTDSATGASNLFVGLKAGTTDKGAVQMPKGVKPSVFQVFPCDGKSSASSYYAWEDTRQDASNYPWTGSWANQDIIFKVTLTCAAGNTQFKVAGTRLVK